jgi:hypothetical protein
MALRTLERVFSSMVKLCVSLPCCSIFGRISASLFPLTFQLHFTPYIRTAEVEFLVCLTRVALRCGTFRSLLWRFEFPSHRFSR